MRMHALKHTRVTALAAGLALAAALAGCGTAAPTEDHTHGPDQASNTAVSEVWIKAVDSGMTAAFAVVENTGHDEVVIVSAASDASAMVELHETVESDGGMSMTPVDGGFVIPAGQTLTLEPGGYHIMFMDVTEAIEPGDEVVIALGFGDGSSLQVTAVAKEFLGANETYEQ